MNLHDEIARVAYELYLKRGCVHGHDLDDWLEAEWIVLSRRAGQEIEEPEEEISEEEKAIGIPQRSETEETVIEEIEPSIIEAERRELRRKALRKRIKAAA